VIDRIVALFEALRAEDLENLAPAHLERFSALYRHWASLADLSREVPKSGLLADLNRGERGE
jgi:hypothetical protein